MVHVVLEARHKLAFLLARVQGENINVVKVRFDDVSKGYHCCSRGIWREAELVQHAVNKDFLGFETVIAYTAGDVQDKDQVRLAVIILSFKVG